MSSDPSPVPTPAPLTASDLAIARFIATVEPAWRADSACCCPSRPSFRVLLPRPSLVPTDLLFCARHFRISRARLAELGASAYDQRDELLSPDAWRLGA